MSQSEKRISWKQAVWDEIVSFVPCGCTFYAADLKVRVRFDRILKKTKSRAENPYNSLSEVLTRQLPRQGKIEMIQDGFYRRLK